VRSVTFLSVIYSIVPVGADYGKYSIATLREVVESLPVDPLKWELE
jgi:hypothetical protein